jgi:hypothetical protein
MSATSQLLAALVLVGLAATGTADTCTTKLMSLCGPERSEGEQVCERCLQEKYHSIGFSCFGSKGRAEEEAFCRVPAAPTCDSTLAKLCGSVQGGGTACSTCAGQHAADLEKVNCTQPSIAGFCTRGINPLYRQNITVFHVNPASYGLVPIDMNTGDAAGDLFFWIKSVQTPLECAKNASRAHSNGFDCRNAEVTSPDLSITKLVLEVDNRYTSYSMCNICVNGRDPLNSRRTCTGTVYVCDSHSYGGGGGVNASIGRESVFGFFGRMKPNPRYSHGSVQSEWWQWNAAAKIGGWWYSSLTDGLCNATSDWCTWRVAEVTKRVPKACADNSLYDSIEAAAGQSSCFKACGPKRNTSSACWIECFYSTTLGADSSTKDTNSTGEGLSLEQLVGVWERPFSSTDTAEGGCPDTSGQTPSPPPLGGY